jgi:hypothetical protein
VTPLLAGCFHCLIGGLGRWKSSRTFPRSAQKDAEVPAVCNVSPWEPVLKTVILSDCCRSPGQLSVCPSDLPAFSHSLTKSDLKNGTRG